MPDLSQPKHLIGVSDISDELMGKLFLCAAKLKKAHRNRSQTDNASWRPYRWILQDYVPVIMFNEPSTRTSGSFAGAATWLGCTPHVINDGAKASSRAKGESLRDNARTMRGYFDAMVLRDGQIGSAADSASVNALSVINAGDGAAQHPTQALLDWFTMQERHDGRNDLTVTLVGDLRFGRTIHSLIEMACQYKGGPFGLVRRIKLVGPIELDLPRSYKGLMEQHDIEYSEYTALSPEIVAESDAIYMTRTQLERMPLNLRIYYWWQKVCGNPLGAKYMFTPGLAESLRKDALLMHPLPRNEELPEELDDLPQAVYWEQVDNGMFVRMALLLWVFGKIDEVLEM